MPRAVWSGAISFGLVNIPVKLFSAISQKEVHFHMLHAEDGERIHQKRVCSADGQEVPYDHIVKGYEFEKGQYVTITREELQALDPKATGTIEIEEFVELSQIDPVYFEHTYHVVPEASARKAYGLLFTVMRTKQRVGVARVVLRTKQYLAALRPLEQGLCISTMNYADEIVDFGSVSEQTDWGKPNPKELKMAEQLVESLEVSFEPAKYHDEYRERLLKILQDKAEGKPLARAKAAPARKVTDLMEALKRSLAEGPRPSVRKAQKRGRRAA